MREHILRKLLFNMKNKGLSTVVATLMMVLLTLVLVGILWAVISGLVNENTDNTKSCFNIYKKVEINGEYTCYNGTGANKMLLVSLNQKDLDADEILISVNSLEIQKSYALKNYSSTVSPNMGYYNKTLGEQIAIPGINSGRTYIIDLTAEGYTTKPTKISVVPIINGEQCDKSDELNEVVYCTSLLF